MSEPTPDKHPTPERCFHCASDKGLSAALSGRPHPDIHMQTPSAWCPWEDAPATPAAVPAATAPDSRGAGS